MSFRTAIFCAGLLACFATSSAARAADAPNCDIAYQNVAQDYWVIVHDMIQFKSMFDHYDRICTEHAPDKIAALQPTADQLRTQVKRDIDDARAVMAYLFDHKFADMVPASCKDDKKSRDGTKKSFLKNMDDKASITQKRLDKGYVAKGKADPALTLCTNLAPMKVKVEKHLGPTLDHPLLEMATLHSSLIRHAPKQRKKAFALYRAALEDVRSNKAQ